MNESRQLKGFLWLGSAGSALILGGIISILAANWVSVPFVCQIALALAPLLISLVAAWIYYKRKKPSVEIEEVLGEVWSGSVLCAVALLARVLQLPSDGVAFCVTMTVLLSAVTFSLRSWGALFLQAGFALAIFPCCSSDRVSPEVCLFLMVACGLLLLPRVITIWRQKTVLTLLLRYVLAGYACVYVIMLMVSVIEWLALSRGELSIFMVAFSYVCVFAYWLEHRRAIWDRPLTTVTLLNVLGLALVQASSVHEMQGTLLFWLVPLGLLWRVLLRSELILLLVAPAVFLTAAWGLFGNVIVLIVIATILVMGLLRGSRWVANFALLFLLAFCFSMMADYDVSLMTLGIIFVLCGVLFYGVNLCFARFSGRLIARFPVFAQPYCLPTFSIAPAVTPPMRRIVWGVVVCCCVAQVLVPCWMLVKRHLILTHGERIELEVSIYDPRDLFAGRYVQLAARDLPASLADEAVPRNYLRYYCDERYAEDYEYLLGAQSTAVLVVRLRNQQALAEALLINDEPAHVYVQRQAQEKNVKHETVGSYYIEMNLSQAAQFCLSDERYDTLKMNRTRSTPQGITPFFVNVDCVWDVVLNQLGITRHAADLPHEVWMDRWMCGKTIPSEAFLPVTPSQRSRRLSWRYFNFRKQWMLPAFHGVPKTIATTRPFDEVASLYYSALTEQLGTAQNYFSACPPADAAMAEAIWTALQKANPEARWVIFADAEPLPPGFPWNLPKENVIAVLSEPPQADIAWIYSPAAGTPLEQIVAYCQAAEHPCLGWVNNAAAHDPVAESYWRACNALWDNAATRYHPEAEWTAIREKWNATTEPSASHPRGIPLRTQLSLAGMILRQRLAQTPNPEWAAQLRQIEALLLRSSIAKGYRQSDTAEAYAQWHLRLFGVFPDWHEVVNAPFSPELTQEDWNALNQMIQATTPQP